MVIGSRTDASKILDPPLGKHHLVIHVNTNLLSSSNVEHGMVDFIWLLIKILRSLNQFKKLLPTQHSEQ